jgi:hypothetical protein
VYDYVSGVHEHIQRLVSVVRMVNVRSVVRFLWIKRLSAKDIHKEMFPVYGGKCLSHKAVHNWMAKVSLMTERLKRRCGSG